MKKIDEGNDKILGWRNEIDIEWQFSLHEQEKT